MVGIAASFTWATTEPHLRTTGAYGVMASNPHAHQDPQGQAHGEQSARRLLSAPLRPNPARIRPTLGDLDRFCLVFGKTRPAFREIALPSLLNASEAFLSLLACARAHARARGAGGAETPSSASTVTTSTRVAPCCGRFCLLVLYCTGYVLALPWYWASTSLLLHWHCAGTYYTGNPLIYWCWTTA